MNSKACIVYDLPVDDSKLGLRLEIECKIEEVGKEKKYIHLQ